MPIINLVYEAPREWKPGANTLLYLKFNNNLDDSSGNGVVVTGGGIQYGAIGGYHYIENTETGDNCNLSSTSNLISQIGSGDYYIGMYVYAPTRNQSSSPMFFGEWYDTNPFSGPKLLITSANKISYDMSSNTSRESSVISLNSWHHIGMSRISGTLYFYLDGNLVTSVSETTNYSSGSNHKFYMMGRAWVNQNMPNIGFRLSEVIFEKEGWDTTKYSEYYNLTKGNYGL